MQNLWKFTKLLLDHNASTEIRNENNDTPLMVAACVSKIRLLEILKHTNYRLNNKAGRKFVEEIFAHPNVKEDCKEALKELQNKQKPLKKKKSAQTLQK